QRLLMLAENEREQCKLERMAESLDDSKMIFPDVGILRRISYKALFREGCCEMMIVMRINFRVRRILGTAFQAMLTYDDWTTLTGFNILRHQQYSIGKYMLPNIKNHFISSELFCFIYQPCSRIRGKIRRRQPSDYFFPNVVTIPTRLRLPILQRSGPNLHSRLRKGGIILLSFVIGV